MPPQVRILTDDVPVPSHTVTITLASTRVSQMGTTSTPEPHTFTHKQLTPPVQRIAVTTSTSMINSIFTIRPRASVPTSESTTCTQAANRAQGQRRCSGCDSQYQTRFPFPYASHALRVTVFGRSWAVQPNLDGRVRSSETRTRTLPLLLLQPRNLCVIPEPFHLVFRRFVAAVRWWWYFALAIG